MKKEIKLSVAIGIMVVLVGLAFYGGTVYQKSQSAKARGNFAGRTGANMAQGQRAGVLGQNGLRSGGQPISGQVASIDDKSMVVKMNDGSSRIVMFGDSTVFNKSSVGVKTDLKAGDSVMAIGTKNSDNSVTAQSVQITPAK